MTTATHSDHQAHVIWVYSAPILTSLDSATWIRTTDELRLRGWQVTLVSEGPTGVHTLNGVPVYCIARPTIYLLGPMLFHLKVLWFILQQWRKTDIVLFHQMALLWLLPVRWLRLLLGGNGPLLVMDTRDLVTVDGTFKNRLRTKFFDAMHWIANRWTDGQTTITKRMAELVHVPADKLWGIWPSGVDIERNVDVFDSRQWPAEDEQIELIYIGKLHRERGIMPLCLALNEVSQQGLNFRLSLVGDGPQRDELAELASKTAGRIRVLPQVPHTEIPMLLQQSHIGVTSLPAVDNAKFQASSPIKLFEYMAAGLPILATRNACHTDVVGSGRYVFWAQDADKESIIDALHLAWEKRFLFAELGQESAQSVHDWTWHAAAGKLSRALQQGLLARFGRDSWPVTDGNR